MKLRPEYQEIVNNNALGGADSVYKRIESAVMFCQNIADQPPKELTDDEIERAFDEDYPNDFLLTPSSLIRIRAVIAAHIVKQSEPPKPVTLKLRMIKRRRGYHAPVNADYTLAGDEVWASEEFDSPPLLP